MPAVPLRLHLTLLLPAVLAAAEPAPFNTEKDGGSPMSAVEAAGQWKLPEGFQATVFAAEPEVRQPIAMCLDERGRLWVAESDTFAGHLGGYWDKSLRDRIVILEDTDHDGRHDKRTVFAGGLQRLTSIERGFGGVWALTLPHLVFIPDQDRDDKPDGPPRVILDGFNIEHSAHTMANGLRWGPDGWLYGRQGILGTSLIGTPGTPDPLRARISPGIWRVHPQRHTVEVVCEGTTNPWGMDWNELGEAFFINTVIGHLWHVIPGAHYRRMFGEDLNPHVYHLIDQHADHVHWDAGEVWSDVRKIGVSQSLTLKDGRIFSGIIRRHDDRSLTLQAMLELVSLPAADVAKIETLPTSLMPEGLLNALRESEVRDLIGWLMDKGPPAAAASPLLPAIEPAGDWQLKVAIAGSTESTTLEVAPPPVLTVAAESFATLPLYNPAGGGWNNGARLAGNLAEACTTPGLIDISSVIVRPAAGGEPFVRGKDWEIHNSWGTFGRLPGGAIGEATPVTVAYRHSAQRLDSIVVDARGAISIRRGAAVPANALPPALAPGERRLANVWIPGPLASLTSSNIFPVLETSWPEPPPAATPPALAGIREKLLSGEPVRILAWGDSVTDAVYLPQAEKWQEQFAAGLREAFPAARTEWITEAWGGRSTLDYLTAAPGSGRNFEEQILAHKPDLVISEFVNDAHLPPESIVPQYEKILAAFQGSGAAWIILTPHYVRPDWMQLAGEQEVDEDPRPYVATLREFAATRPVALADASRRYGRLWRQGIPHTTLLVNSINHPDARGMKLFADSLMDLFPPAAKP